MTRRLLVLAATLAALLLTPSASAAVWCGNDVTSSDRPDATTGAQVHLVYAIPSDGVNAFSSFASAIATDAETVDAWWRRQDPLRTPRFDVATFPGCSDFGALDISFLQLSQSATQLGLLSASRRFAQLYSLVPSFGPWKKTVVYYDGPIVDPDVCGIANGSITSGFGSLAVVFPRASCAQMQPARAAVLAHELTHSLGFPDERQPHPCPGDTGHVCDSELDLMYPYLSGSIDQLTLDAGRDDYYRWGGTNDLASSSWLRRLEAPPQQLALTVRGGGQVTSDVPGVSCSATCATSWDVGTRVTLSAIPGPGQRFVGWKGACSGLDCAPTLSGPTAIEAVFAPILKLTASVAGKGRVLARGLACPSVCRATVDPYPVVLTAKPARGWRFAGWTGSCKGTKAVCRLAAPTKDVAVRARFTKL